MDVDVVVIGAGPAGLSCAHRLAVLGHDVMIFDKNPRPGGLNEYGIAAYKTVDDFAAREVDYILGIGKADGKVKLHQAVSPAAASRNTPIIMAISIREIMPTVPTTRTHRRTASPISRDLSRLRNLPATPRQPM